MPLLQSIENARAERIGPVGVTAAAFADALGRAALAWLRACHADGGLALPAPAGRPRRHRGCRATLGARASDVVLLGTGGSSLGGQTLAQLTGHGVPGLGVPRGRPRLHAGDHHRGAPARGRRLRPAGDRRGQGLGQAVSGCGPPRQNRPKLLRNWLDHCGNTVTPRRRQRCYCWRGQPRSRCPSIAHGTMGRG
jgi:hypothetical protein